jgi:hypothetical protein
MAIIEFEGFDAKTTKALKKKVAETVLHENECDLCEAPATVETSQGDYCAACAEDSGPSDYSERMAERRQMGLD